MINKKQAREFCNRFIRIRIKGPLKIGNAKIQLSTTTAGSVQYSDRQEINLLFDSHKYIANIDGTSVLISIQFYLNTNRHYRLFVYSKTPTNSGMCFTINLTTCETSRNEILLKQRVKFSEGRNLDEGIGVRNFKTKSLCNDLKLYGFNVTDKNEIVLGKYNAITNQFTGTNPSRFLNDLLRIAILKGHYQGNKGFHIPGITKIDTLNSMAEHGDDNQSTISNDIRDIRRLKIPVTECQRLIDARLGQGAFRSALMSRRPKCSLTGIALQDVLIASHINPWSRSNNLERLDPENGILLCANIDRLFDQGLISFR